MSSPLPRARELDSSIALLREGYRFGRNRFEALGSDAFRTRLMLRPAVLAVGEEAAREFYHPGRMTRRGALPPTALLLLQDLGSVQMLDGDAHRRRKAMFMSLMSDAELGRLADRFEDEWRRRLAGRSGRVVLFDEVRRVLLRTACAWAGVAIDDVGAERRTREMGAMIDGAGKVGPRNWVAQLLRLRSERWARRQVQEVRAGRGDARGGRPVDVVATHRDLEGEPLPLRVAAIELLNLLRPTVAVARFVTFAALALHEHPGEAEEVQRDPGLLEPFVHEVRRFYPFFPAVGGRALEPFEWRGHRFRTGSWFLLDLDATNRDPRIWGDPERFRPARFRGGEPGPFTLVPQGAGDAHAGHRCPGEPATVELMKRAVRLLGEMRYEVPDQDLRIDLSQMPALPESRFVVSLTS